MIELIVCGSPPLQDIDANDQVKSLIICQPLVVTSPNVPAQFPVR